METHYYTATSIDGRIADEENSLGWLFQFSDDPGADDRYAGFVAGIGAIVMGSTTYEWLLREEIRDDPSRWPYAQPTWVFTSRTLPAIPGADLRFVSGPVEPVHAEIAATLPEGQDLWLVGGGELVGMFLDAGLLDLIHLGVAPVFLGAGAPLLPRRLVTPPLVLEECRPGGPFALLRYRVQHG
ncbi:dihydrofolate reductase family protein [Microlunatus flavus]|uniref:Dihydrofolate reductase n=1 Tax=Microlunatus flavus TaxID=1036181 RepID=A0A1H9N2E4_9ACTN|nr:dihydrofolate reductase family protein [Microlunatus flavus]SER30146.1 Dihydrofolate reductase [Microlunatus flavus]